MLEVGIRVAVLHFGLGLGAWEIDKAEGRHPDALKNVDLGHESETIF